MSPPRDKFVLASGPLNVLSDALSAQNSENFSVMVKYLRSSASSASSSSTNCRTMRPERSLAAKTLEEMREIVAEQLDYYNRKRRHSALAYRRPYEVVSAATTGEDTLLNFS